MVGRGGRQQLAVTTSSQGGGRPAPGSRRPDGALPRQPEPSKPASPACPSPAARTCCRCSWPCWAMLPRWCHGRMLAAPAGRLSRYKAPQGEAWAEEAVVKAGRCVGFLPAHPPFDDWIWAMNAPYVTSSTAQGCLSTAGRPPSPSRHCQAGPVPSALLKRGQSREAHGSLLRDLLKPPRQ